MLIYNYLLEKIAPLTKTKDNFGQTISQKFYEHAEMIIKPLTNGSSGTYCKSDFDQLEQELTDLHSRAEKTLMQCQEDPDPKENENPQEDYEKREKREIESHRY
jgi:hypothetical protein